MDLLKIIEAWLVFINIFTFVAYALDKYKAIHHAWRIPERTLILLAAIGGSVGALFAMCQLYLLYSLFWHILYIVMWL